MPRWGQRTAVLGATALVATLLTAGPASADPLPPPPVPEPGGGLFPGFGGELPPDPDPSPDALEPSLFAARSAPLPTALEVPDPTDFDAIEPDPADYGIAPAAERFATGDGEYSIPRPAPGGDGAGTVPEGLEEFYDQQVEWGSCEGFGAGAGADECAYVIAPLDYSAPDGPTIALAVARAAAESGESLGAVFTDPGGPGSPGLVLAGHGMFAGLAEDFDTVGIDPRGVGASVPMIRCQSNEAWDWQRQGSDGLDVADLNAILEYNTDECYENTGAPFGIDGHDLIGASGTVNVVKDLDLLRSVLGDAKLNYIGFSYGTSIGYEYARQFPDNIRAMVIDGVVNVLENNPEELAKYSDYAKSIGQDSATAQIAGFQATFEQFLAWCATNDGEEVVVDDEGTTETFECALVQHEGDPDVGEDGPDNSTEGMLERYRDIARAAWGAQTYASPDGRPLSFADFNQGTIMAMYTQAYWDYLNTGLLEATDDVTGNEAWMMILSDAYAGREGDGSYSLDLAAFPSIWCTDSGTPPGYNEDVDGIIQDLEDYYAAAPFTDPRTEEHPDRGMEPVNDWCTYYEDQFTLPAGETLEAMPNVLVVSTTYDSATPYDNGVVAAAAMGATLLTVAGYSHTSYGGSECATQIADSYFHSLVVPTDIPGVEGVPTKDVYSNVITGDECMVDFQFRPTPELTTGDVDAGDTTAFDVTGLVRNTAYTATTEFGSVTFTTDESGSAVVAIAIPADAAAGSYDVSVVPADPEANDPTVRADGTFEVVVPEPTPTDPTEPTETGGADGADGGSGTDGSDGTVDADGTTAPGDLATTGAPGTEMTGLMGLGALLLAAGAAAMLARRRRLAA